MYAHSDSRHPFDDPAPDNFVELNDVSWRDYERLLAMRGEKSVPRITYLEGRVELMSPSRTHEAIKSWMGGMVEAWCFEREVRFSAYGSWTLKDRRVKRGVEPDECYVFGPDPDEVPRPHLAIEVIWTHGGIDKLEVYRRLGVAEVWIWQKGRLQPHALRGDRYVPIDATEVLPGIDLDQLVSFLDRPTMYDAVRDYRAALAAAPK